ncbi:MAG TPA: hypothetical protein VKZ76_01765 [Edaphocola sp.]|nr:hypothetical protein [Edaphocola sp.]
MKKQLLSIGLAATAALVVSSCKKTESINPEPQGDYVVLSGNLGTQTLSADKKYLLQGQVFVPEGHTLTIEPGTVIFGEKRTKGTLIITPGAKIIANGNPQQPIVFTSNQAPGDRDRGDWGGLVILGKAPVNIPNPSIEGIEPAVYYGGDDENDNSGSLQYVRVEFAGIELSPNNETNGITFGGVGRGTNIDHVMVSYGGDDGIEWFGGTVNAKHLVVFATWDDCFDIDNGYSGNLQFGLSVRYPSFADQSESNAFEWDTNGNNEFTEQPTRAIVSNFTVIGPSIDGNSISGNFKYGLDLRRRVAASLFNSVVVGFPNAVRMNQNTVFPNYQTGEAQIANNIFYAKNTATVSGNTDVSAADILSYLEDNDNLIQAGAAYQSASEYTLLGLNPIWFFGTNLNTAYPAHPSFILSGGLASTGASFDYQAFNKPGAAAFFDKTVNFRGAFGAHDWTQGWTNFNPINTQY